MNTLKAWLLMGLLTVILVLMGNAIGGNQMAVIFFIIAMAMNFFSYFYSDKIAIKMTRSYPVSKNESPELYEMVETLTKRAGLSMPKLYVTPSEQPNAFATGRNENHAAIAVTEGIMRGLNRSEIEGVLAHEIAHIKNKDILIGTIAAALAGAITMLGNALQWAAIFGSSNDEEGGNPIAGLILAVLAPIAAMLIQMAISRSREYKADADGAIIANSPDGLANALLKLESYSARIPMQVNPSASHMFIVNPLRGESIQRLFSTHPSTQDRVARLKAMRR